MANEYARYRKKEPGTDGKSPSRAQLVFSGDFRSVSSCYFFAGCGRRTLTRVRREFHNVGTADEPERVY